MSHLSRMLLVWREDCGEHMLQPPHPCRLSLHVGKPNGERKLRYLTDAANVSRESILLPRMPPFHASRHLQPSCRCFLQALPAHTCRPPPARRSLSPRKSSCSIQLHPSQSRVIWSDPTSFAKDCERKRTVGPGRARCRQ